MTDNSERFENKDDLLLKLEIESEKCKNQNVRESYSIRQVDENGVIKEKTSLTLPLSNSADASLIDFGNSKPKNKRFAFPKGKKDKQTSLVAVSHADVSSKQTDKVAKQKPSEEPREKKPSAKANPLKGLLLMVCLIFIGLIQCYNLVQNQVLKSNYKQVVIQQDKLQNQLDFQKKTPGIDTFSRYFIPSYFSGNVETVKPFYSKKLHSKTLVGETRKLQSVILKDVKKDGDKAKVTYALVISNGDNNKSINLSFEIKYADNGKYDYQVVSIPEEQ
ncbi:hypothetical protein [Streptococcus iniae]|uniref:hypothetical protein n=1 Tax=Streptococcus iniae TaxID=1346 RepID=UPI0002ED59F9|nr:hypothetical protein [Streptococcus iniae]